MSNKLDNRAGETTEARKDNGGAPSCGIAKPGGGIERLEAAAAAARAGDASPRAVDRVAAAVANVGFSKADKPANLMRNNINNNRKL